MLYRHVQLTRPTLNYTIFGLNSGFPDIIKCHSCGAAAPHRPGLRSHRALPPTERPSLAGPAGGSPHPAVPRGSIPGLRHTPTGKQGHIWARDQCVPGIRAAPACPRCRGAAGEARRGPSPARVRRMRGPVPPRRRAERWGGCDGGSAGVAVCGVGVPQPVGVTRFIPRPACSPRRPSAPSLCPQRASVPQSRLPAWRGCAEGCTA